MIGTAQGMNQMEGENENCENKGTSTIWYLQLAIND
jgi:hypothetical protein